MFEKSVHTSRPVSNMPNDTTTSATPPVEQSFSFPHPENYKDGPFKLNRNDYGLLQNVDYKFTEDGFVDWRAMISPKFLYPNKGWFERAKKETPSSIEGLEDHQLLCKLGGYKELARLRGYSNIAYRLEYLPNGVSAVCTIQWIPNYETGGYTIYESIANSTSENCGEFSSSFKETQAENRSLVRCIRNFLNIHVVGDDEMPKGKVEEEYKNYDPSHPSAPSALDPQRTLEQHAQKKYKTWADFRKFLMEQKYQKSEDKVWNGYSDIPPVDCGKLINLLIK